MMPRPITVVRWLAATYTCVMGFAMTCGIAWSLLRHGGVELAARAAPVVDASATTWLLFGWFICAGYTGWRAMDREATK